jgi:signal transduction histidine kinase
MTPAIQTLFNCLSDGLVIVARDASVRFANAGARKMLPIEIGKPFPHAAIGAVLEQALAGHIAIPHSFESEIAYDLHIAEPDRLDCHVLRSPAGQDLVLVLHDLTEATLYHTTLANLGTLVEHAFLDPLLKFSTELEHLLVDLGQQSNRQGHLLAQRDEVVAHGKDLIEQLRKLAQLAQLGQGRAIEADDRIVVEQWLPSVVARHDSKAVARRQRILIEPPREPLPALYASAHWLGMALDACLSNAIEHSPAGGDIVLSSLSSGGFIRITLRNNGRGLHSALLRQRLMQPLMRGKQAADTTPGLGLGLPLARSIVEMHQGRLILEQDLDGFVTCAIELPACASSHASAELHLAQAQRYANDLARLMTRRQESVSRS